MDVHLWMLASGVGFALAVLLGHTSLVTRVSALWAWQVHFMDASPLYVHTHNPGIHIRLEAKP